MLLVLLSLLTLPAPKAGSEVLQSATHDSNIVDFKYIMSDIIIIILIIIQQADIKAKI